MYSRIHNRLGTAGMVVAVMALIIALAGTAYAAAGLSGKQKKEVAKIARKYGGRRGRTGPAGPEGPQGPTGPAGPAGKSGTSVKLSAAGGCPSGGTKLTLGSESREVCNGRQGPAGPTETVLPNGATEVGVWSFVGKEVFSTFANISYPLMVPSAPAFNWVFFGETNPNCPGSVSSPEALPGNLCVYAREVAHAGSGTNGAPEPPFGASLNPDPKAGLVMEFVIEAGAEGYGYGTWAVTASD